MKFLTTKELAKRIRVSEQTLRQWRMQKMGPPYAKFGKSVLYPEDKLGQWVDNRTVTP